MRLVLKPKGFRWPAVVLCAWAIAMASRAGAVPRDGAQIPAGPPVRVSDGWYHLEDCRIAVGRRAPAVSLADALRQSLGPCPICEPLAHESSWAAFVAAHGEAIREEMRRRREAEAAEERRRREEAEAERVRRLAVLEADRKRRETAPIPRVSEAEARQFADAALAGAEGDPSRFENGFRTRVRQVSPDYAGPQTAYASPVLRIHVLGPVARFEAAIVERLGQRRPASAVPWIPDVTVAVLPAGAEAPDVTAIVVQRTDALRPVGAEIPATVLSSTLAPRRMAGPAVVFRHAGEVVFPRAAFEPGENVTVRVIAVVAGGGPALSRTFTSAALRLIQ